MNNKITIIEGPAPTFEPVNADWAAGVVESPEYYDVMMTNLRTMNGRGLVERCYQTWTHQDTMYLHFRNSIGLEQKVPIIAAQNIDTKDGQKLILWVRMNSSETDQLTQPDENDFND